MTPYGSRP